MIRHNILRNNTNSNGVLSAIGLNAFLPQYTIVEDNTITGNSGTFLSGSDGAAISLDAYTVFTNNVVANNRYNETLAIKAQVGSVTFPALIHTLAAEHFHAVVIADLHVAEQPHLGYAPYNSGETGHQFVSRNGADYVDPV